jgi:4-amino-4-deoxy-L-arabinose transferase-like glycosyltransferase
VVGLNLFLFKRLLERIREFRATHDENLNETSDHLFTAAAYLLFLWCHLDLIQIKNISPDFLVTTSVLVCAICLINLLLSHNPTSSAAGLGVALGIGYLIKAIMFVAAPFFILAALFCAPRLSKGFKHVLLASLVFGMISAPNVWLISRQQGHLTYSETGKLAYAWMVNNVRPYFNWQGDEPGSGTPEHPTRRLLSDPEVFEFGDRPGTYPPWFDPTYWHKGLRVEIDFQNELKAIKSNLKIYCSVFFKKAVPILLLVLFAVGILATVRRRSSAILRIWPLLIPALAGLCIYLPVYAMTRHLAPFVLLFFLTTLTATWRPMRTLLPSRVLTLAIVCVFVPFLIIGARETIKANFRKKNDPTEQRRVAVALTQLGLQPGDRIAILGRGCDAIFARLARLKIVAEAYRDPHQTPLWVQLPDAELRAVQTLRNIKAKAIIRDTPPQFQSTLDWKTIPDTQFSILFTGQHGAP